MNAIEQIKSHRQEYSLTEQKIFQAVIENPVLASHYTIGQLADFADVSVSAVLRFTHSAGYSGYKEFHYALLQSLEKKDGEKKDETESTIEVMQSGLEEMKKLDRSELKQLKERLQNAKQVLLIGGRKEVPILIFWSQMLFAQGISNTVIDSYEAVDSVSSLIHEKTCILLFAESAKEKIWKKAAVTLSCLKGSFTLITDQKSSAFAKYPQILLPCFHVDFFPLLGIALGEVILQKETDKETK